MAVVFWTYLPTAYCPLPTADLPVLETRRPLLDEGGHAFLLVFGGEERMEDAPLEAHAFGERRLIGAVDAFLGDHHRRQRIAGDRRGGLQRFLDELVGGNDARDEAATLRLGGVHHAAGEDEVHRLGLADEPGETLRAAGAGNDAELDLRLAQFRRLRR